MTRYRLDSQFHCSYLESRGVPGKQAGNTGKIKSAGNTGKTRESISLSFPVHDFRWCNFGDATSGDVLSGDTTSGRACARDHFRHPLIAPPQMRGGWCFYTTYVTHGDKSWAKTKWMTGNQYKPNISLFIHDKDSIKENTIHWGDPHEAEHRFNRETNSSSAGVAGMLLHINGIFTIWKFKSSLYLKMCSSRYEVDVAVLLVFVSSSSGR